MIRETTIRDGSLVSAIVSIEEAKDSRRAPFPDSSRLIDRSALAARLRGPVNTCASFRPNLRFIAVAWLPSCLSRYVSLRTCTRVPPPSSPLPAAQLACTAALILDERTKIRTRMRVNSNEHSGETRVEWPLVSKFRIYDGSRTSSVENQFSFCRSSSVQLDKSITPYLYGK